MRTLNLGILAHVDAGKTSLTERLLYAAGVIDEIGSVDDGNTQTDTLALERQRGITIKTAVASFALDDVAVNLIDTPGHPDFIAEVERVLYVLDGAVLVVSAVEGVQAQTRVLMRTLQRLRIPTLIFVNKIDRRGAQHERTLQAIAERLTPSILPMGATRALGTRDAQFTPYGAGDGAFSEMLAERLTDHDEALLTTYLDGKETLSYGALRESLVAQTARALVHPVFFGSAITGAGVGALMAGWRELLPAAEGDAGGPVSGTVFKVERGPVGEKIAYVRMFSGTVRTRDRVRFGEDGEAKVNAIAVFDGGTASPRDAVAAGQIGRLWGLGAVQIGDSIGVPRAGATDRHFAPPTLETVVTPRHAADKGRLRLALAQLAEQDPLINLRQDDVRQELFLSLYGEVQKEVIQETLATEFDVDVAFRETTPICVERPVGRGEAVDLLGKGQNPFLGTIGLRVEPGPLNSGVRLHLDVKAESVPVFVFKSVAEFREAVEETVRETLAQGLYGWQVTDCAVTLTECGYSSPGSTPRDFRLLTPLVLMGALREAGTVVCEPMHRFRLEVPADTFGRVVSALSELRASPQSHVLRGPSCVLEGDVPAAHVRALQQRLPALSRGEGVLESAFDHYRPLRGEFPIRPRTDNNPLNRKEYLLRVHRRV
jgi:ribosomal protection tetracycline resistance protein